jgi:hypothetical protein
VSGGELATRKSEEAKKVICLLSYKATTIFKIGRKNKLGKSSEAYALMGAKSQRETTDERIITSQCSVIFHAFLCNSTLHTPNANKQAK